MIISVASIQLPVTGPCTCPRRARRPQCGDITTTDRPTYDLAWVPANENPEILALSAQWHRRVLRLWDTAPQLALSIHGPPHAQ